MITGFNTDIEFDGVVYHVQTEDKGLDTPLILSLVYVGGAILASKRSTYYDLISAGFDPLILAERLQRQHKLLCAAIKAGRIEDLKRLSQRDPGVPVETLPAPAAPPAPALPKPPARPTEVSPVFVETSAPEVFLADALQADVLDLGDAPGEMSPTISAPLSPPPMVIQAEPVRLVGSKLDDFIPVEAEDALHLSLLEERDFHAGEVVTLRIRVSRGGGETRFAAADIPVTVKILGTEFRPLILTTRSDRDGVATIHAWLPRFTKGRAAVLMRAAADGYTAELRRVIHQA